MTSNEPVELLPVASVAVQATVVVPSGKVEPDAGEQTTDGLRSTASVAVASYVTTAPPGPVASAEIVPGSASAGAVVSATTTSNEPADTLPESSTAVQSTLVVPSGKVEPESGAQATVGSGSTTSVASTV